MKNNREKKVEEFQKKTGIVFKDTVLLKEALTHRSFINELSSGERSTGKHNERLEFLGDAVLELVVTEFLFSRFLEKPEGELTSYRAALVNTQSIKFAGQELSLTDFMFMSEGEARDTGKAKDKITADAFEALIGAIYLDKGYDFSKEFISQKLLIHLDEILEKKLWQDAKSHFQELAQEKVSITPDYKIVSEKGPDHDKIFEMSVYLENEEIARGKGASKQEAEQEAAKNAIEEKGWN